MAKGELVEILLNHLFLGVFGELFVESGKFGGVRMRKKRLGIEICFGAQQRNEVFVKRRGVEQIWRSGVVVWRW